jgi:precorrin-6B methylase 2
VVGGPPLIDAAAGEPRNTSASATSPAVVRDTFTCVNRLVRELAPLLRRIVGRLPGPLQRALFKGGQRSDRLHDPDAVLAALGIRPGDRVADLGPGYGHFTLRIAKAVGPDGLAYAADADADTLDDLRRAADERGITTLRLVLTSRRRLELPEPVDLLFVSATYHHLLQPVRYFSEARSMLRPTGRVAILESRLEGPAARWMNPHGSVPRRVHAQMSLAGYELVETHDVVHGHWFAVFRVRGATAGSTSSRCAIRGRRSSSRQGCAARLA